VDASGFADGLKAVPFKAAALNEVAQRFPDEISGGAAGTALHAPRNPSQQFVRMYGLIEDVEVVASGAGALHQVNGGRLTGEQEDFAVGQHFTDADGDLNAVHVGHDDVTDQEGRLEIESFAERGMPGIRDLAVIAALAEDKAQGIGNQNLVICDQHLQLRAHESPALSPQNHRSEFANTLQFRLQSLLYPLGPPFAAGDPAHIGAVYAKTAGYTGIKATVTGVSRQFAAPETAACHH